MVNVLAHIWFALSTDIVEMFAARILAGLAAGNTGVIQAMIADRVNPGERARYMGFLGSNWHWFRCWASPRRIV